MELKMNSIVVVDFNDLKNLITECIYEALAKSKPEGKKHESKLLTLEDVLKILGVSDTTIYQYRKQGKLRFHKLGRRIYFYEHEVYEDLNNLNKGVDDNDGEEELEFAPTRRRMRNK
jgi:excisionase family DNA binding protein